MIFQTTVAGIPCQCRVTNYVPYQPMRITGSGFGDAEPPQEEEFDYQILDRSGYPATWLENKLTLGDDLRLLGEYKIICKGLEYEDYEVV